jgi:hypothetical protein
MCDRIGRNPISYGNIKFHSLKTGKRRSIRAGHQRTIRPQTKVEGLDKATSCHVEVGRLAKTPPEAVHFMFFTYDAHTRTQIYLSDIMPYEL